MYDDLLIPTDGSDAAESAVEQALGVAEAFDATVHVLYVVERIPGVDHGTARTLEALREAGERATAAVEERAAERGLEVVTAIKTGSPHQMILDYAEENDVDVVVMGTHGRSGVERYLLGSVAEKVVRLSDVPVLTVRQESEEE